MAKTLSYINTSPKTGSKEEQKTTVGSRSYSPSGSGLSLTEVLNRLLPLIAENYADTVSRLMYYSYLYNPAFADSADGWTVSDPESVYVMESDGKNRLFISNSGSVVQLNELIRKPGKHKEYALSEKKEEETSSAAAPLALSGSLVTDPVEWEGLEEPVKTEGEEEKPDILYLEVRFVCKESGTISVGFSGSDESSEDALKTQTVDIEESAEIQSISTHGTWDGKGNFFIHLPSGQVEIVSLSLAGHPLDEFRKQTDSHLAQISENVGTIFEVILKVLNRIVLVQQHVNQLYSNDAILDGWIKDLEDKAATLETMILVLNEKITEVETTANTAYEWALENRYEITYTLKPAIEANASVLVTHTGQISSLQEADKTLSSSISSLQTSLSSLAERVAKLEKASET